MKNTMKTNPAQLDLFGKPTVPPEIQKMKSHGAPLSDKDLNDFSKAQQKIFNLMKDGQWHTATSVIDAAGIRSGLRLMRTFRDKGLIVNKRKTKVESREWEYQLLKR